METRALGKTGEELSVIGFGAIVFVSESPEFAHETVARAIDAGVNYLDMGPRMEKGKLRNEEGPRSNPTGTEYSWPRRRGSARKPRPQPSSGSL